MIRVFQDNRPNMDETSRVAESADVIGKVTLKAGANIWYGAVLRGDSDSIMIGKNTNIQDNAVVHVDAGMPTFIGDGVTVGHGAIVHGCTVSDNVLIGMGSIILDGAVIEENVIIGAGALVPPGKRIPSGSLVVGSPGKVVRALTDNEIENIKRSALHYVELAEKSF
ncbi:MAG: gamma carbonic anhydrase family protein [Clostridia bacterium]|nr:gamma carbonic anhydrase family protein [Clostridia bacterium]